MRCELLSTRDACAQSATASSTRRVTMRQAVLAVALAVVLAAGTLWVAPAQAAPDASDAATRDRVTRFLQDRGLLRQDEHIAKGSLIEDVRSRASDLVLTAMNFLGVPYRRGGVSEETGFDCSGFTRHVFENSVGLLLPRRSQDQAKSDQLFSVRRDDLKPGDLVFFNTMRHAFSHVGIYIGDDKFIHSPRTGGEVRVEDMRETYWLKRYNGARRAPTLTAAPGRADTTP